MTGPRERGFWTGRGARSWGHLVPGRRYRVARPFVDFDGVDHPVGEEWLFLGSRYQVYDDGLSLFVSLDGEQEWHIRLRNTDPDQGALLAAFADHVVVVAAPG
jgi:hypothetical protein